jgi:TRAP-type mannitol/chloroaromatic compound transport system substrate-binding protein
MEEKGSNMRINHITPLILLLLLTLAGCTGSNQDKEPSQAKAKQTVQTYEWKMVTTWPPNFPVFQEGVDKFAEDVRVMSDGRLKIKVFAGGELVPPLQTFDAVSQGTVQLGHGAAYYWAGKIPAAQFFTSVPFGMNAQEMTSWIYGGGGLKLWQDLYSEYNLVPFPMGNTGVQMGGWFNKKINSLDDIKGLKMRIPGLGGKVFAKAGGTPVLLAGGEIYTALDRGTVDATEWVGPFHDERLGLDRAAKYYYYPGWHEPGSELELLVNGDAWKQLPDDLKKIVEITARATSIWMFAQFEAKNASAYQELKNKQNVEILPFPDDVLRKLHHLSDEVYAEEAAKDPKFKKIYAAFKAYQEKSSSWNEISEVAYQRALQLK